jgi:hypothetical protein
MDFPLEDKRFRAGLIEFYKAYLGVVTDHGVKAVARTLRKSDKTVYAEVSLEHLARYLECIENFEAGDTKPSYMPKLGFVDVMLTLMVAGDVSPFVVAAGTLNLMAAPAPDHKQVCKDEILGMLQRFNKEYVEAANEVLDAIQDKKISLNEARKGSKEMLDIINVAFQFKCLFDRVISEKG